MADRYFFRRIAHCMAIFCVLGGPAIADVSTAARVFDGMPDGAMDYAAIVELWDDFLAWKDPKSAS